MWKELGEALGDLAGTHVGERVNMVSAAWSTRSVARASRPWMGLSSAVTTGGTRERQGKARPGNRD